MTTPTREVGRMGEVTGPERRTDAADLRRFAVAVVGFAVLFTALGRLYGEDIALVLQKTPTTQLGWRFIGWLVAAPPMLLAMITWHERRRLRARQRRDRGLGLAAWLGLSMFVLPSRTTRVDSQFGTGALVGDPLSSGWAWGALAAMIGLVFSAVVLVVLHRTVRTPSADQRDLTVRFLERAWLLLIVVSLAFALYGADTGIFQGGT